MILTKTYPANRSLTNVLDELFNTFPPSMSTDGRNDAIAPVNIIEVENGFNLEFNVPGRNKENFKINVDKGLLTVSYEQQEQPAGKDGKVIRNEFSIQNFKRSFSLDEKVNADGIEAKYENGILKVLLPKKEEVKAAPKQISIL